MKHSFLDQYCNKDAFLQRVNPLVKLISFIVFILFVVFTPPGSFASFSLYGVGLLFLSLLAKLPLGFIFKRLLMIVPFVLLIAIFIPFCQQGAFSLTITARGLFVFWNVMTKSLLSALAMILLTSTTRFSELLKALERLRCPRLIVMVLSFMYRYLFVFTDEIMKMQQAREARALGGSFCWRTKTLANMIGVLFLRAYERAEKVYLAMCARGFTGEVKTLNSRQLRFADICFFTVFIASLIGIRFL